MLARSSNVYLSLPHGPDRDVLRASLLAIQGVPTNLPSELNDRNTTLKKLEEDLNSFVFLDISRRFVEGQGFVNGGLAEALNSVPKGLRRRTVLTQIPYTHVSTTERSFVVSLGFYDYLSEFDSEDVDGRFRAILSACSRVVGTPPLSKVDLTRYLSALGMSDRGAPRLLVRKLTGVSVEVLVDLLAKHLEIQSRVYHFKKYLKCFVASEAIAWMAKRFRITISDSLLVGRALSSLGLIYHVEHEHQFADDYLFFRLVSSPSTFNVDLGDVYILLSENLNIDSRTHMGKIYPNCWVGSEAIDLICERYSISRYVGYNIMHWLEQLGMFDHVVHERPFIDENYFYRFHHQFDFLNSIKSREILV